MYSPTGEGIYCVGNVVECDYLTVDGATRIPWGKEPAPEDLDRIRCLDLVPSAAQLRRPKLPPYLADLPHLRSLSLPAAMVALLGDTVPPALVISGEAESPVTLGEIESLLYVGTDLSRVVDPLPPVAFLRTLIGGRDKPREQLRSLTTLRHLELEDVRNDDVLADIRSPVEALEIAGTGRRFPMTGLPKSVKALRLNGVRAEIDCSLLTGLDELDVLNSRKFTNIDALLEIPSVRFLNCGNPFKGRPEFQDRGFDIAYA